MTTAPIADPLYRTNSLLEIEQPHGSKQEGETGAEKIQFALKETNQCWPMIYGQQGESIIGNKAVPLIVHLLLHLFTPYGRMAAHCSSDLFTPQPDNSQWKTNSGKDSTALSCTHTMADSDVF
jgi:hypothetical protein